MPFMAMTYIMVFIFLIGCTFSWFCLPVPEKIIQKIERNRVDVIEKKQIPKDS